MLEENEIVCISIASVRKILRKSHHCVLTLSRFLNQYQKHSHSSLVGMELEKISITKLINSINYNPQSGILRN